MENKVVEIHGVVFESYMGILWNISRYSIGETIIIVKSRQGKGVRFHIMENGMVVKTYKRKKADFGKVKEYVEKYFNKWKMKK